MKRTLKRLAYTALIPLGLFLAMAEVRVGRIMLAGPASRLTGTVEGDGLVIRTEEIPWTPRDRALLLLTFAGINCGLLGVVYAVFRIRRSAHSRYDGTSH